MEMGLTILLMGFHLGGRGWVRRLQFGAGATYVRPGHGSAQFLSCLYLGSMVSSVCSRWASRLFGALGDGEFWRA